MEREKRETKNKEGKKRKDERGEGKKRDKSEIKSNQGNGNKDYKVKIVATVCVRKTGNKEVGKRK